MIRDKKLFFKIKEMFPDAPDEFIRNMYHNINGKKFLWKLTEGMNDDSNSDVK
jgi:hypothetical protein